MLSKIPLTLAWDLPLSEAQVLFAELPGFPTETKLQGGLPSTFSSGSSAHEATSSVSTMIYGFLSLAVIALGVWYWFQSNSLSKSPAPVVDSLAIQKAINELDSQHVEISVAKPETPTAPSHSDRTFDRGEMDRLLNTAVFIRDKNSLGSGFFITSDGYLLSNAHVTSGMSEPTVVLRDGRQFTATKVREDKRIDASLLKISVQNVDFLKLGNANELYPGEPVITIGNPGGLSFTVTRGIVSYVGRIVSGVPYIQTDAAINRGNSGGPMINSNLEVVGINSLTSLGEQGISFALPINLVCAQDGIASMLNTTPSTCESLRVSDDRVTPASLERAKPDQHSKPLSSAYQSEIYSFKADLDRSEKDAAQETASLQEKIKSLKSQMAADASNMSTQSRLQSEVDEINRSLAEIPKKRAEAQLRYIKQCINTLIKQKADPDFASLQKSIGDQITALEAQQRTLEAALGR